MARQLRAGKGKHGLILANGGVVTYQHVICLSTQPRSGGDLYPTSNPLPNIITDVPVPKIVEHASGPATIEVKSCFLHAGSLLIDVQTYTVEYDRQGEPATAYIVGRLSNGSRFVANQGDGETLKALCSTSVESIGRSGIVKHNDDGRNLFSFDKSPSSKL